MAAKLTNYSFTDVWNVEYLDGLTPEAIAYERLHNARHGELLEYGARLQQARCPECGCALGFPEIHDPECVAGKARMAKMARDMTNARP